MPGETCGASAARLCYNKRMDAETRKAKMIATFDAVSTGYDNRPLRFFSESAKYMTGLLNAPDIKRVLDVATGTGNLAIEIARTFPHVQVTGIDFSPGMLAQARMKAETQDISNVQFLEMDMHEIALPDGHFDAAVCAFGIFFAEDMTNQLRHIVQKVRSSGRIVISCFYEDSFLPLVELLSDRLERYGIERPSLRWKLIATAEKARMLVQNAGLEDIRVERRDLGYYLKNPEEWWDIVWNAGFRSQVSQLPPQDLGSFRDEHLVEVETLRTQEGIRLNVTVIYASGVTPGGKTEKAGERS
jgi:ubiquinone/menaquinone biosynthesis C-methylase UbiE